ncbi:putative FAD-binding dehydrogenase [Polystyrenella longa]|uniref:Putative FAD-binding dehydrogenase n=1 Tax=Polystyrenella longa TaxID=2528007 RepID=A0A518CLT3_9PLAN|nr:FAD-dependent oxidoreductase [Polystyrenella longa]QDU80201.1 putative FAD-binding dehydrogenase [Polystyrenella longa]
MSLPDTPLPNSPVLKTTELHTDILVAGGGPAGVCAALAAARTGAKVILCQDRPVLGGNASSEIRMHIVGANGTGGSERGEELVTEAREGGIIEEIRLENSVRNPQRSSSMFDLILYDKCRTEPNLKLMLNTTIVAADVEDGKIVAARGVRHSTEDEFIIRANTYIDCTGDGRLGVEAGAPFMEGREDKAAYGEKLAQQTADNLRLGSTILIQARKHDRPMPYQTPSWVRSFSKEELKLRLYATPGDEEPTHEYGYWWAEWGGTHDTIRDNEVIRDELLAVTLGIWDHIKNGPPETRTGTEPGSDPFEASHWALEWCGFVPGKRESRRFIGQHVLTEHDILNSVPFSDAIAFGGWSLDLHPPEGVDVAEEEPCVQHEVPHLYDIPLRACVSKTISNLMFAGRNISATHVGFASTRVMATCAVIGQGVGTAAAIGVQTGISPGGISSDLKLVHQIQQQLLRDGCYLIGVTNEDSEDLARTATVTSSSEQEGCEAFLVVSGQTRAVFGKRGAPVDRARSGVHRWMSDPTDGLPAWIQLEWSEPVEMQRIELTFDTGMHRHLTLSLHDGYTSKMQWGVPQPETVADYEIELFDQESNWQTIEKVSGNFLRQRKHIFGDPQIKSAVRVRVLSTQGIEQARICEIRIYSLNK